MADVEAGYTEERRAECIFVSVCASRMSYGECSMIADPAVIGERYPHDTELRRHFKDVVTEKRLLFVCWEKGVEMFKAES